MDEKQLVITLNPFKLIFATWEVQGRKCKVLLKVDNK